MNWLKRHHIWKWRYNWIAFKTNCSKVYSFYEFILNTMISRKLQSILNEIKTLIAFFILNQWSNCFWKLYDFIRNLYKPFQFTSQASWKSVINCCIWIWYDKTSYYNKFFFLVYIHHIFFLFHSFMFWINKICLKIV